MKRFCWIALIMVLASIRRVSCENPGLPIGFIIGASTSHVQTEGAWNVSDKSEGTMDYLTHQHPELIIDGSNADIAADSYHKYKEDVQLIRNIKFDAYRISISWARLLPNGCADYVSADGLAYYKNFVKELIANGIKPIVTLYHMDHPQIIDEIGGWFNERTIDLFADYARVIFTELGPMVKTFVTFNEPQIQCKHAADPLFRDGAGFVKSSEIHGSYSCMHNILKAHARAWHIYDQDFRPQQKGKIGLVEGCYSYRPQNASSPDDLLAAEYGFQFTCGWSMHPVFIGDYSPAMKTRVAEMSRLRGFSESRLPSFTDEEIQRINLIYDEHPEFLIHRGSSDFFGLNYYYVSIARFQTPEEEAKQPSEYGTHETRVSQNDAVQLCFIEGCRVTVRAFGSDDKTASEYEEVHCCDTCDTSSEFGGLSVHLSAQEVEIEQLYVVAPGLRSLLCRIRDEYGNPMILITETGYATHGNIIEDVDRIAYFHDILTNVMTAIREDGCNVVGYLVWTLLDAWEFGLGYTVRFGLYSVDFDSPNRTRTPRWSVSWWKKVMESREVQPVFTPDNNTSTNHHVDRDHKSSADIRKNLSLEFLCAIVLFLLLRL